MLASKGRFLCSVAGVPAPLLLSAALRIMRRARTNYWSHPPVDDRSDERPDAPLLRTLQT